jgi:fructokinase
MMFDALAIGELLIDFACLSTDADLYPTMAAHPGGAPANFLAAMQKFGARTAFISKVGDDAFGKLLKGTLKKAGIDDSGVVMCRDTFTTLAFVTFNAEGDREFSFSRRPGADTRLRREEIPAALLDDARLLHFGTLSLTDEPARGATEWAVGYAKKRGKLITFDPNLRKPLWDSLDEAKRRILWGLGQADVVKISDEEAEFLFGELPFEQAAEKIRREFGVKLVFLTLGKNGCLYQNENACGRVPGLQGLHTIDTTGAGDIFGGSAVWKVLQSGRAPEALADAELRGITRFACAAAGLSTTKPGGIFSVPELSEVEQILKNW